TKQQTFPINALRPEWYDDYKAGIIKREDLSKEQIKELNKWLSDDRSIMELMYENGHIKDTYFFTVGDVIPGAPSFDEFCKDFEDKEEAKIEYDLMWRRPNPESFENFYRSMCGQQPLTRLSKIQAIPCFIYAMKKAGANFDILEKLKVHCNTKFTKFKKIAKLAESMNICIRLDTEDKAHDEHQTKSGVHKFRTDYIGIPKEYCKYYDHLTYQSILDRESNENGFDSNPNRDYFELALIHDYQSGCEHYFANPIIPVSPYYFKHRDKIKSYASKNNIPLKSLQQVNQCKNGKYYIDKTKKHSMRLLDLIVMTKKSGGFARLTMEEMLTMPQWDGNLNF
ncbi:hypothetical protein, partial [Methanobrevibacter sp.]